MRNSHHEVCLLPWQLQMVVCSCESPRFRLQFKRGPIRTKISTYENIYPHILRSRSKSSDHKSPRKNHRCMFYRYR
jgi:hypothetical protein